MNRYGAPQQNEAMRVNSVRHLAIAALSGLILFTGLARATEPQLPIRFVENEKLRERSWVLELLLDLKQVENVQVSRMVYRNGELLTEERLRAEEGRLDPETNELVISIPLRFEKMKELKEGAYAQKLVAKGRWSAERDSKQMVEDQRWVYFVIEKGVPRRVNVEEYSRLVDPPRQDVGIAGEPTVVQFGIDRKEEMPADRTKPNKAISLGREGGVPLELPVKRRENQPPNEAGLEKSETDED